MKENEMRFHEYVERINGFLIKRESFHKNSKPCIKCMKLKPVEFSIPKKRATLSQKVFKNPQKMSVKDEDEKKVSFIKSAYTAYKCCQNQDLHLFQLDKIYLENKIPLKNVARWRFPKKWLIQMQLRSYVDGLKSTSEEGKKYPIKWIIKAKNELENKRIQEQLEIQKQGKEKRAYLVNKPIF